MWYISLFLNLVTSNGGVKLVPHNYWSRIIRPKKIVVLQFVSLNEDACPQNRKPISLPSSISSTYTAHKMKLSIKNLFSKCHQIRSFLWIWSHLLKKSLMENFIFCAVLLSLISTLIIPLKDLTWLRKPVANNNSFSVKFSFSTYYGATSN